MYIYLQQLYNKMGSTLRETLVTINVAIGKIISTYFDAVGHLYFFESNPSVMVAGGNSSRPDPAERYIDYVLIKA